MRRRLPPVENCLNCGADVRTPYCPECGQEAVRRTASLSMLLGDLADQIFNIDSKVIRSVVALITRPGYLTNAYNSGRHVRYVTPLRLYLFFSVLFFLVLNTRQSKLDLSSVSGPSHSSTPKSAAAKQASSLRPGSVSGVVGEMVNVDVPGARFNLGSTKGEVRSLNDIPDSPEQLAREAGISRKMDRNERWIFRQVVRLKQIGVGGFISRFVTNLPTMMFFMLPLFAFAVKLLYLRNGRLYVEHLVFLLHVHAFLYLALTLMLITPDHPAKPLVLLVPVSYLIVAIRRVYRQPWWKTLLKFSLLACCYNIILSVCLLFTILATFLFA